MSRLTNNQLLAIELEAQKGTRAATRVSHDARLSESSRRFEGAVVPGAGIEPALAVSETAVLPNERSRISFSSWEARELNPALSR